PGPGRLQGRRHHLPPAGLLGPHRPGRARRARRARLRQPAPLRLPDILVLKVVKRLLDTGVSLQQIRVAVGALRERGIDDLAGITLMSDGASVYECTSAEDVFDLVQGGQGVFGIAVGRVWREVENDLSVLPGVDPADDAALALQDELAARRRSRQAG